MANEFDLPVAARAPPARKPSRDWKPLLIGGSIGAGVLMFLCSCVGLCVIAAALNPRGAGVNQVARPAPAPEPEKVTRTNFERMGNSYASAEEVLGRGRHDFSGHGHDHFSWRSKDGRCIINATTSGEAGFIVSKTIIGD